MGFTCAFTLFHPHSVCMFSIEGVNL